MVHTALSDKTYLSLELLSPITILRRNCCLSKPTIKPVISGHAKNRQNKDLIDRWYLNEGRKYCRMLPLEHSAIRLPCIKR